MGSWFTGEVNAVETLTCGDYEYIINDDETVSIAKYNGDSAEFNIPQIKSFSKQISQTNITK